ncbi:MarR family transcriptional regulator [Spongiibacter sp. KMU-166]|uniref:MarR family transcriptional regulator n=1 Tax=Spongiibacter thalassae TaxID=2721624 RepID=A0ABX1GA55_9GAMM|nr:MarR family transcriptional regulator [Spongiibacter thalassae]NKI16039.1 MarR family transcriptional regulator [Spongiibacter thalassae]
METIKPREKLLDLSAYLIIDLGRLIRKHFDTKMSGMDLTRAEWYLISYLCFIEGSTQQEIADALDMAKGGITKLIRTLEEKDLVMREAHNTNGRATKRVFLTAKGRKVAKKIDKESDVEVELIVSCLNEKEKVQLNEMLHRIRNDLIDRIERGD